MLAPGEKYDYQCASCTGSYSHMTDFILVRRHCDKHGDCWHRILLQRADGSIERPYAIRDAARSASGASTH